MTLICVEDRCGIEFPYSGRGPRTAQRCQECRAERKRELARGAQRRYRLRLTPDELLRQRARYGEWYAQNVEACRAKSLAWYNANHDRAQSNRKAWDQRNPDYNREWVENNRGRHNAKKHRRRAREADAFVEHVDPAVVYARDRGICHLCRRQVPRVVGDGLSPSLDHVKPLARGGLHSYNNVRLAHRLCNARKGAREVMPDALT